MVDQQVISIGDTVRFTLGTTPVLGVIVDDRGPIGANGVRIYRVRIPNPPFEDEVFEMPEDELDVDSPLEPSISSDSIVEYLQDGGLLQILRSNMSGGSNQPRVWLTRDTLGNVVHTFIESRSRIGGGPVPFHALHNDRIFAPKLSEVQAFLMTFGLSQRDAQRVIAAVGTDP